MSERLSFNQQVIEEFRANDGVCGGPFEGAPMILVTMTGAKSGRELCSPLVYSMDGDDHVITNRRQTVERGENEVAQLGGSEGVVHCEGCVAATGEFASFGKK